jgi:hypothetical protein
MTRGRNDCTVGPVGLLGTRANSRFGGPDASPALQTVGALRQSRRFYAWLAALL